MATPDPAPRIPTAFLSYSWDDDAHKEWVRELAVRLRLNGVDVKLDRWHAVPGDQLPVFMEQAVSESDFVVAVCTPKYKEKMDRRDGGVGYEGNIMAAEAWTGGNDRKFIAVLRIGTWETAAPSWQLGSYYVDLRADPYSESNYEDLLTTLLGTREVAPPIGEPPDYSVKDGSKANPSPAPVIPSVQPAEVMPPPVQELPDSPLGGQVDHVGQDGSMPSGMDSHRGRDTLRPADTGRDDNPGSPRRPKKRNLRRWATLAITVFTVSSLGLYFTQTYRGQIAFGLIYLWFDPKSIQTNISLAYDYADLGNLDAGERYFDEAIRIDPENAELFERKAEFFARQAFDWEPKSQRIQIRQKAISAYDRAFDRGLNTIEPHVSKGELLIRIEQLDQAILELSKAIDLTEENERTGRGVPYFRGNMYWLRGCAHKRGGESDKAKIDFDKSLAYRSHPYRDL